MAAELGGLRERLIKATADAIKKMTKQERPVKVCQQ